MRVSNKIFISFLFLTSLLISSCKDVETEKKDTKSKFDTEDTKLVKAAILDYVEGLYLVDSTRIDRSVDKKLRKIGYWFQPDKKEYVDNLEMSYTQLSNLAANWNKNGNRVNEKSPKKIEIFDVNTKTASAKLTAEWGIDLFHLAKVNNRWKIVNVIWQSQPEQEKK